MACSPIAEGATSYFFNSYSQSLVLHCGANGIGTPNSNKLYKAIKEFIWFKIHVCLICYLVIHIL